MLRQISLALAVMALGVQVVAANSLACYAENPKGELTLRGNIISIVGVDGRTKHRVRVTSIVRSSRPDIKAYKVWSKGGGVGYLFLRRFDCPEAHPGQKPQSGFVFMDKSWLWSGCCEPRSER